MQQYLVTGGAGFIGSNLIEALLDKNERVRCIDNLSTGKIENIDPFRGNPNFEFIQGDIRDTKLINEVMSGIEIVLHQAALGSVPRSIEDPVTSMDVNIIGTANIMFHAQKHRVKRVVYAASSSTYGDSKSLPKVEEKIGKPLSPYAISKYVNEITAENFHKVYNLDAVGLRYFNVFGRRQDTESTYAAVIPKFVKALMNHEAPVINGDGSYSRDFTYIDNVIQANILAATTENKDALNQVYNVAYGGKTNLNELFNILREELSQFDKNIRDIHPKYGPNREGDIPHSLASIEKVKKLLGYNPKYDIVEGLKEAVKWYWENL